MTTTTKSTAIEIVRDAHVAATAHTEFSKDVYDNAVLTLGDHRIVVGTEWDDQEDGEVWGYSWTTYIADADAPHGWEDMGSDGTQDPATLRATVDEWIATHNH